MALLSITRKKTEKTSKSAAVSQPFPNIAAHEIIISDSAAKRIKQLLTENPETALMRVGIIGGGCSGFSYNYVLEKTEKSTDLIFEHLGIRVCIDPKSIKLIGGSLLEWHEELGSNGFRFRNKRETKSCSCGQSFSL